MLAALDSGAWSPVIPGVIATNALNAALAVGATLRDPESIPAALSPLEGLAAAPDDLPWRPASLGGGHSGIALLAAYLDACVPGAGWDHVGHAHLVAAVRDKTQLERLDGSLFAGWAGVIYAARSLV